MGVGEWGEMGVWEIWGKWGYWEIRESGDIGKWGEVGVGKGGWNWDCEMRGNLGLGNEGKGGVGKWGESTALVEFWCSIIKKKNHKVKILILVQNKNFWEHFQFENFYGFLLIIASIFLQSKFWKLRLFHKIYNLVIYL